MEIHKLLRKLEPLVPKQVDRWRRTFQICDADVKALLQRQIRATAERMLGDVERKPLLSLPPKPIAKGALNFGTILYEQEKWEFGLQPAELMQNLAILGRSGAGKTNVSFHLLKQLVDQKIPFLFLDWKRTARHLFPHLGKKIKIYTPGRSLAPFPFNPFLVPPGVDSHTYVNQLVDVMADAYTLGDGAISVLQQAIHTCYDQGSTAPTVAQIVRAIEDQPTNQRSSGWKITAKRACESLEFSQALGQNAQQQQSLAQTLLHQNTIIELDGISQNTKRFLIPLLCYWIYSVRLGTAPREQLQYVIFLEEAHHVLYRHEQRAKETLMNVLLRQCRELGIGTVLIDQHPHLLSSAGIGNCYSTICLNLRDPPDINRAAGLSALDEQEKRFFSLLPVGQAIVKLQDRWREPFVVQFPLVEAKKGLVTDQILADLLSDKMSWSELRCRAQSHHSQQGSVRGNPATPLDAEAVRLILDISAYSKDGVDVRYQRLGVSAEKGNRWKRQLLENGLIHAQRVKVGRTYRLLLRLTSRVRSLLYPQDGLDPQASFLHEYWKRRVARQLETQGYRVQLEAPRKRGGGRIDILATRASRSVAVEIETGKSNVVANVRRNLLDRPERIIVIATSEQALTKVEQQLAKSGLLIPGRVSVSLQDALVGREDHKT